MQIEKLYPACKDYLWGGDKLKERYGKVDAPTPCAESWELSFHEAGLTRLADGRTLAEAVTPAELGANLAPFGTFPVLVKLIDAKKDLSVQVHPDDAYAQKNEHSLGKTEMWYVVEAEEGAALLLGFRRDVTAAECREAISAGRFADLLRVYPVKAGDCFFIPAGTVHAICRGCLVCEVQQNSNVTYRVYDYDRVDKDGSKRPLHVDKALDVMRFEQYTPVKWQGDLLAASRYFTARSLSLSGEARLLVDGGSFLLLTCTRGQGRIAETPFAAGDSFFVPAGYGALVLSGEAECVLTEVRRYTLATRAEGDLLTVTLTDDLGRAVATRKSAGLSVEAAEQALLAALGMTRDDVSF